MVGVAERTRPSARAVMKNRIVLGPEKVENCMTIARKTYSRGVLGVPCAKPEESGSISDSERNWHSRREVLGIL